MITLSRKMKIFTIAALIVLPLTNAWAGNDKKVGVSPHQLLPDGVDGRTVTNPFTGEIGYARKGTVGAMLANTAKLNQLLVQPVSEESKQAIEDIGSVVKSLIPNLKIIGVFDLFSVDEWLQEGAKPGRVLVAIWYLQQYPEVMTTQTLKGLNKITDKNQLFYDEVQKIKQA